MLSELTSLKNLVRKCYLYMYLNICYLLENVILIDRYSTCLSRSRFKFDVVNRYFYSNETARDDDISGTIIIHIKK